MTGLPYYFRYPSNALAGMQALTLEERGAYNTIIDLIYDHGGPIEDDEGRLRGYMNCDVRVWRRVRATLLKLGKISLTPDGLIANGKATRELAASERRREVGRKSGVSSGEVRRTQAKKRNKINGKPEPDRVQREDIALTEHISSPPADAARPPDRRAALPEPLRVSLIIACGVDFVASYFGRGAWVDIPRSFTPATTVAYKSIGQHAGAMDVLTSGMVELRRPDQRQRA